MNERRRENKREREKERKRWNLKILACTQSFQRDWFCQLTVWYWIDKIRHSCWVRLTLNAFKQCFAVIKQMILKSNCYSNWGHFLTASISCQVNFEARQGFMRCQVRYAHAPFLSGHAFNLSLLLTDFLVSKSIFQYLYHKMKDGKAYKVLRLFYLVFFFKFWSSMRHLLNIIWLNNTF